MDGAFPGVSLGLIGSTTIVPVGSGELGDVTYGDSLVGRRWENSWCGPLQMSWPRGGEGRVCEGQATELRSAGCLGCVGMVVLGF